MAKLQRKTQKIFSSNAATNEHAVFGTMKNIVNNEQPQYSMDVEVLQSGTAFLLGWQNAVVAGFAPFLEEMNGVLYVITSQLAYLLNNGVAEYDANTTYYQGDIIKVLDNGVPTLKYSVIDNNTGNDTSDEDYWTDLISETDLPIATTQTPGIVQPDGETITITPQGIISAQGGANTDLSNLTDKGNAKFQYAPFSINNGTVDGNGQNATLQTVGDVPVQVDKYVVPQLSSNTSEYGTCTASSSASTAYQFTGTSGGLLNLFVTSYTWSMTFSEGNYIPAGASVTFDLYAANVKWRFEEPGVQKYGGNKGCKITYTYTDDTTEVAYDAASEGYWEITGTWTKFTKTATSPEKDVKAVSVALYRSSDYVVGFGFNLTSQYTVSSADTLICKPCTITASDGRTKTFSADNLLDCSSVSDGTYKVMKSYTDGSLSLVQNLTISKTNPRGETLWTQPVLSSNGTLGGNSFAVDGYNLYGTSNGAYQAFDNNTNTMWTGTGSTGTIIWYNPIPLRVTAVEVQNRANGDYMVRSGTIYGSNDNSNWTKIQDFSNSTSAITFTTDISNADYYNYYKYEFNSNSSYNSILEIKITAYTDAQLSNGALWLDTSEYPLTLKQYDGINWQTNDDLVYLGDVTVANGVITSISNNEFNEYGYLINQGSAYIPDYTSSITRAAGTSFTIEAPSLLEIITYFSGGGSNSFEVTINGKTWNLTTPSYMILRTVFLVKKGDNINVTYNTNNQTCNVVTYLLKGTD